MKNGNLLICMVALCMLLHSCLPEFSCDEWANDFRDSKEFNMILTKKKNHMSRDVSLYGVDPKTKKDVDFVDGSGWIQLNLDSFKIGDTITKKIGKYTIVIKRRGSIKLLRFECGGKIYRDSTLTK